ncbi:ArgE/DapE family deacylase [Vagococcus fluvialis]|uniref:ArgE/DapE family deacylase n=1 Tax=Vagococcus fluvialis TaxID=2738 RepID=UPI00378EC9D4
MKKEEKISLLQDIIRIKSENGNEAEVANFIEKILKKYGIESKIVPYSNGRSNLVATISNGKGKTLGLTGHMDVVAAGESSDWLYPPYEAHIDGNKMYGRGTTDMKSGLMAMVIAMIELKEQGVPINGTIKLLATVGEEVGELGSEQLTQQGYVDDINGLIIGEPTNYNLMYTHMGSINYKITSYGKAAHSSMPELGINAINHLNNFITIVNEKMTDVPAKYKNDILGRTIHSVTTIHGGTQVNSIPDEASLQGNIRSIPEFSNDQVVALLENIIDKLNKKEQYDMKLEIQYNKIPVKADEKSGLIQAIQSQFSKPLPLVSSAGTTDAAEFTKSKHSFDFVVFGPGVSNTAHQINEYVEIDNYLDMIDKYQSIAKTYLI